MMTFCVDEPTKLSNVAKEDSICPFVCQPGQPVLVAILGDLGQIPGGAEVEGEDRAADCNRQRRERREGADRWTDLQMQNAAWFLSLNFFIQSLSIY